MKILFAIQGTGNGHLSRAKEIIPYLLKHADVDLLVSGTQSQIELPYIVKYKKRGISFTPGSNGKIDYRHTITNLKPWVLMKDIYQLPVSEYDLVLNDFEPISAWACKLKGKECVSLSHQAAFLSNATPRPDKKSIWCEKLFSHYAPCSHHIGFHFKNYAQFIKTPIIRNDVRVLEPTELNHITVYLPACSLDFLVPFLEKVKDVEWHVFSKNILPEFNHSNIKLLPITNDGYLKSLASSRGLLTGGGFEAPAEATYLNKKVLMIPIEGHYEQECNSVAFKDLGGLYVKNINLDFRVKLNQWLTFFNPVKINFPDITREIVEEVLTMKERLAF